jgi:hypothetical protein
LKRALIELLPALIQLLFSSNDLMCASNQLLLSWIDLMRASVESMRAIYQLLQNSFDERIIDERNNSELKISIIIWRALLNCIKWIDEFFFDYVNLALGAPPGERERERERERES